MFSGLRVSPLFSMIWKSKCLPKQKVFMWLLLVDWLNSRDMMERRHWTLDSGVNCALCQTSPRETRLHLFFNCRFAQRCWRSIDIQWGISTDIMALFQEAKDRFTGPCFFEIISSAPWNIWMQRNAWIFERKQASFQAWHRNLIIDLDLITHRVRPVDFEPLKAWISSLP